MKYQPDESGWYLHEKAWMHVSWWLFLWLDRLWFIPVRWITNGRVSAIDSRRWLELASDCWLLEDLKRGDLPPNNRVGGIWA